MTQNTSSAWRKIASATLLTSSLYGCGGQAPDSAPEIASANAATDLQTVSTENSTVIPSPTFSGNTDSEKVLAQSEIYTTLALSQLASNEAPASVEAPTDVNVSAQTANPSSQEQPSTEVATETSQSASETQSPTPVTTTMEREAEIESLPTEQTEPDFELIEQAMQINESEGEAQPSIQNESEPAVLAEAQQAPDLQPIVQSMPDLQPSAETSVDMVAEIDSEPEMLPALAAATGNDLQTRSISIGERAGDVVKILDGLTVSASQLMVQQTPVDTQHGYVYTANIEHGTNGDENGTNLHTVVRMGKQDSNGSWDWSSALIEDRTVYNQWHTAPSIAADNDGYIHVAYNMHNFPWQYKRSTQPHDLDNFEFLGQSITHAEINRSKFENKTTFPTLGHGQIPGNQITYPAFFKDRNRDIYATYRFAAKPKRSFEERTMSGAIASYDTQTQSWRAIGGQVPGVEGTDFTAHPDAPAAATALAAHTGWTVYHPRLMFGPSNDLHVNWFFRQGIAGAELSRPCYVKSQDTYSFTDATGNGVTLPMDSGDCGNIGYSDSQDFYSIGNSTMDSTGKPFIVLSPIGGARQIVSYDANSGNWEREDSPNNATEIFFDGDDNLWAVASGIRIMVKLNGSSSWDTVYSDSSGDACFPKVSVNETGDTAFVHTHACDQKSVTIYGVRLN